MLLENWNYVNSSRLLECLEADGSSVQLRATALNALQKRAVTPDLPHARGCLLIGG